jgi:hypothetical protein
MQVGFSWRTYGLFNLMFQQGLEGANPAQCRKQTLPKKRQGVSITNILLFEVRIFSDSMR